VTPSLVVSTRSGTIASRTTNSDMRHMTNLLRSAEPPPSVPLSRLCGRGDRGEGLRRALCQTLTPGPSPAKPGEGRTYTAIYHGIEPRPRPTGSIPLFGRRRLRGRAGVQIPAVVLNLFLVAMNLVDDLVQRQIDGGQQVGSALAGHQFVLVLRTRQELDFLALAVPQVHGHFDHCPPAEIMQQPLGLGANLFLVGIVQVSVPDGNLDLHSR